MNPVDTRRRFNVYKTSNDVVCLLKRFTFEHTLGSLHVINCPRAINLLSKAQFKSKISQRRIDREYIPDSIENILLDLYRKIKVSKISEKDFRIINES